MKEQKIWVYFHQQMCIEGITPSYWKIELLRSVSVAKSCMCTLESYALVGGFELLFKLLLGAPSSPPKVGATVTHRENPEAKSSVCGRFLTLL